MISEFILKEAFMQEQGQTQGTSGEKGATGPDKGKGYFPLSDLHFDVVTLVYEKSKALQAYDSYLRDSQANKDLQKIFEEISKDDRRHIEMLKKFLGNC
jgi:hypothetical protein